MGLPLHLFGKVRYLQTVGLVATSLLTYIQGSLFGPYTPLQQLDILVDEGTKSYIVGSTNPLLLDQKNRYCDVLINVSMWQPLGEPS